MRKMNKLKLIKEVIKMICLIVIMEHIFIKMETNILEVSDKELRMVMVSI